MLKLSLYKPLDGDDARINTALMLAERDGLIGEGDAIDTATLLEHYPFLKPEAAAPTTVPSARSAAPQPLTAQSIADMTPDEYAKRRDEIHQALREGRITP